MTLNNILFGEELQMIDLLDLRSLFTQYYPILADLKVPKRLRLRASIRLTEALIHRKDESQKYLQQFVQRASGHSKAIKIIQKETMKLYDELKRNPRNTELRSESMYTLGVLDTHYNTENNEFKESMKSVNQFEDELKACQYLGEKIQQVGQF